MSWPCSASRPRWRGARACRPAPARWCCPAAPRRWSSSRPRPCAAARGRAASSTPPGPARCRRRCNTTCPTCSACTRRATRSRSAAGRAIARRPVPRRPRRARSASRRRPRPARRRPRRPVHRDSAPGPLLSPLELLLAKIALSALIVIGVTLAAERLGPRLGGLIAATPQLSVLALIFFTLEQGHAFAAETAFWTIPGMCATIPVYLAYLAVARRVREPRLVSIALGALAGFAAFALDVV